MFTVGWSENQNFGKPSVLSVKSCIDDEITLHEKFQDNRSTF